MDRGLAKDAIRTCLTEARKKLDDAARIARAAEACAEAGSIDEGVRISMDAEQLIYEAGRLHDAASLMNRLSES